MMNRIKFIGITCLIFIIVIHFISLNLKFEDRFAYVMFAEDEIIGAQVSDDQQWRIRCDGSLPAKLAVTIKLFEDQYFNYHFGVNPISIFKALFANFKSGKTVRGGSTLTMQLARIHEGNQARTYLQKCKEIVLAIAIEYKYSKAEILKMYAQYAPFGGNTVGYCAAAKRYYDKNAENLSWSEAATLAVLPNAPSDIYPGKSQQGLIRKRNFLLRKLLDKNLIDSVSYRLSIKEDLPQGTRIFDNLAPHLLQAFKQHENGSNYMTTLDYSLQRNVRSELLKFRDQYESNDGISNLAALVIRNDGSIASYVANVPCSGDCGGDVDLLTSLRSPGSTLKPFLYGRAMEAGIISEQSLIEDVPVFFNGFTPKNFDLKFRGLVPANEALTTSLNIPAVNLLAEYGTAIFLDDLKDFGFHSLDKEADHYGLSLILGGGEITPLSLGQAYNNLARVARGKKPVKMSYKKEEQVYFDRFPLQQGTASLVLRMLKGVNRPSSQDGWEFFANQKEISWKTGTSYGFRDAWAVGVSQDYTVLVWVGNADGEGRQGLTGIKKAAPILFNIFDLLPLGKSIVFAHNAVDVKEVCSLSGYIPNPACTDTKLTSFPKGVYNLKICPYHEMIRLNQEGSYRVNSTCSATAIGRPWFVVDPIIQEYYKSYSGIDLSMPPMNPECAMQKGELAIVYPTPQAEILLPRDLDEQRNTLICKAVAGRGVDSLYWFVDDELHSVTKGIFKVALDLDPGPHTIAVVSPNGQQERCAFSIIE